GVSLEFRHGVEIPPRWGAVFQPRPCSFSVLPRKGSGSNPIKRERKVLPPTTHYSGRVLFLAGVSHEQSATISPLPRGPGRSPRGDPTARCRTGASFRTEPRPGGVRVAVVAARADGLGRLPPTARPYARCRGRL